MNTILYFNEDKEIFMSNSVAIKTNEATRKRFMTGVYSWMVLALVISAVCAYATATNEVILRFVFGNTVVFFSLVIAELVVVFTLSALIRKMGPALAAFMFILYSILNGVTLASVFLAYTGASVVKVFLITAGMFACMSLYGRFTKTDLRSAGRYLMMALFGIIIASVVNLLFRSSMLDWIISMVSVVVFTGLTAYDTQKLYVVAEHSDGSDIFAKASIIGALELYLDFINIFLSLLRLFGKSSD